MQRIERYGVIALVLLLVTIAAVSFWDDGTGADPNVRPLESSEALAELRQRQENPTPPRQTPRTQAARERAGARGLPSTARAGAGQDRNTGRPATVTTQRGDLPRGSSAAGTAQRSQPEPTFETLPATLIEENPGLSSRGFDRDEAGARYGAAANRTGDEVEFPDLPPRESPRSSAMANRTGGAAGADSTRAAGSTPIHSPNPVARDDRQAQLVTPGAPYVVAPGDTLSEIASKVLGSSKRWPEIQALNGGIDPGAIQVGMKLQIPGGAAVPRRDSLERVVTLESKAIPPTSPSGDYYTVRPGDMLSQIAQDRLGGASRWPEIVALNPGLNPDVLVEGRRLKMPAGLATSAQAASTAYATRSRSTKKNRVR